MPQFGKKPSHIPGIVLFTMLWILSLTVLTPLFVHFRRTGYLELAGSRLEGPEGVAVIAILALIPVTMLALVIQRVHRLATDRGREQPPGE